MAGLLLLGLSDQARADLQVTLISGAATSFGFTPGNVTVNVSLPATGTFTTSFTADGETILGTPASMSLHGTTITSTGAGTATFIFSMNKIQSPVGSGTISETLTGASFASGSGSFAFTTYGSQANTLYTTVPVVYRVLA
jgi:hypothetical protein